MFKKDKVLKIILQILNSGKACDGHEQCADRSDELNCNDVIQTGLFYDSRTIHKHQDEKKEEGEGEHKEEEGEEVEEKPQIFVSLGKAKTIEKSLCLSPYWFVHLKQYFT